MSDTPKVKKATVEPDEEFARLMDRLRWTVSKDDPERTAEIARRVMARRKKKRTTPDVVVHSRR